MKLIDIFNSIDFGAPDECWEWQRGKDGRGYGAFREPNAGMTYAHRWVLGLRPGDFGLALHTCDNPPCCNPNHLYCGTSKDNTRDMMRRGRSGYGVLRGEENKSSTLNAKQVEDIRLRYAEGDVTQDTLAEEYGVTQSTVSKAIVRDTWRHI